MKKQEEVKFYMFVLLLLFSLHLLVTAAGEQNTGLTLTVGLMQFRQSYVKYFKKSEYFKNADKNPTYHLTA